MSAHTALKYDAEVTQNGKVELSVPFPAGTRVVIFVLGQAEDDADLVTAAQSSLDFWDNPFDDEDWNDA